MADRGWSRARSEIRPVVIARHHRFLHCEIQRGSERSLIGPGDPALQKRKRALLHFYDHRSCHELSGWAGCSSGVLADRLCPILSPPALHSAAAPGSTNLVTTCLFMRSEKNCNLADHIVLPLRRSSFRRIIFPQTAGVCRPTSWSFFFLKEEIL